MPSPLEDIENRKAQQDLGAFGYRVYQGALADGASWFDAMLTTVAFFRAVIADATPPEDADDEDDPADG